MHLRTCLAAYKTFVPPDSSWIEDIRNNLISLLEQRAAKAQLEERFDAAVKDYEQAYVSTRKHSATSTGRRRSHG